ncbi:hypothetical protein J3F83DRAFT_719792 [Trichoderma novae-zelandiae]
MYSVVAVFSIFSFFFSSSSRCPGPGCHEAGLTGGWPNQQLPKTRRATRERREKEKNPSHRHLSPPESQSPPVRTKRDTSKTLSRLSSHQPMLPCLKVP